MYGRYYVFNHLQTQVYSKNICQNMYENYNVTLLKGTNTFSFHLVKNIMQFEFTYPENPY